MLRNQALETLWTCWNLTWPCTKDSQNLLRDLLCNLLRDPLNLTWLCTKASWNLLRNLLQNLLRNPVEPDLAPPRPSPEPSPEHCWTCWTWPVSAPNPRPSREPSEPSPEPRWTWPGACTSAHRSYSGLKTPSAYAVGEKDSIWFFSNIHIYIYMYIFTLLSIIGILTISSIWGFPYMGDLQNGWFIMENPMRRMI